MKKVIDTNILIRLLTKDDLEQYQKVYTLFQRQDILLIETVLLETELVLRYSYKFKKDKVIQSFRKLLNLPNVFTENSQIINNALDWAEQGLDFPDALHLAKSQTESVFLTFDQKFIKRSKDMGHCEVKQP
ncbi:type II toxin-antitoxin system VapC family toxin [Candidatus Halobeggiatoa sp. HSG11]|nr:type II toxin-antitoxin system VapC family toxin [Candidatus Halobeggiatoa sp. HSG11]